MKREHLDFLKSPKSGDNTQASETVLQKLGWQPFFAQQTDIDQLTSNPPVRVTEVHRNGLQVVGENIDMLIPPGPEATVGDWLLLDQEQPTRSQVLERKSLIQRLRLASKELFALWVSRSCCLVGRQSASE